MDCPKCSSPYDKDTSIPLMLTTCGHTLCNPCATKLFNGKLILCPECKAETYITSINLLPINIAILSLSSITESILITEDKISSANRLECAVHKKIVKAFCMEDLTLLCIDCILLGIHKQHNIESIANAYNKQLEILQHNIQASKEKKVALEHLLKDIEMFRAQLHIKANNQKNKITTMFEEIMEIIKEREDYLKKSITKIVEKKEESLREIVRKIHEEINCIVLLEKCIREVEDEYTLLSKASLRKHIANEANHVLPSVCFTINFNEINKLNELEVICKSIRTNTLSNHCNVSNKKVEKITNHKSYQRKRISTKKDLVTGSEQSCKTLKNYSYYQEILSPANGYRTLNDYTKYQAQLEAVNKSYSSLQRIYRKGRSSDLLKKKELSKEYFDAWERAKTDCYKPLKSEGHNKVSDSTHLDNDCGFPIRKLKSKESTRDSKNEQKTKIEEFNIIESDSAIPVINSSNIKLLHIKRENSIVPSLEDINKNCSISSNSFEYNANSKDCNQVNLPSFLESSKQYIYIIGTLFTQEVGGYGKTSLYNCEKLDIQSNTWTDIKPITTARSKFASLNINNQIYIIGGKYPVLQLITK